MKKFVLLLVAVAALAMAAHAVTYMCVKTTDRRIIKYDVEKVAEVVFEDERDLNATVSGAVGNYTYVDLGLKSGTMWATYNVGATKPEEGGGLFAWGETINMEQDSLNDYKWYEDGVGYTKYNFLSEEGIVDSLSLLEPADDAATANWGAAWRMPTAQEQQELSDGCTWVYVYDFKGTGVSGQLGTSRTNGNTIFLPYSYSDSKWVRGDCYWSCSLVEEEDYSSTSSAYCIFFDIHDLDAIYNYRFRGCCVRPVLRGKLFTVNFYDSDSTLISSQEVEEGRAPSRVKAPVVKGYTFTGWSDSSFVKVTQDLKIYAEYKELGVDESGMNYGNSYVDLGLKSGLKWAICNVGASKPEEYGNYFAWGEAKPKKEYSMGTYEWVTNGGNTMTKYVSSSLFGIVDNKTLLDAEDDAATANMGSGWRMPTNDELQELIDGCSWEWVKDFNGTGVSGKLGTSIVNGNTIFMPAAGYRVDTECFYTGRYGYYWSSSSDSSKSSAQYMFFDAKNLESSDYGRFYGCCVRAVLE